MIDLVVKPWLFIIASVLIIQTPAFSYRPFGTEDAGVAGRGVAQMEVSVDRLKWGDGKIENIFMFVPIYGVTENLEVSVEIPYLYHFPVISSPLEGLGDINLVGKYLLFPESGDIPAIAVKAVEKLDTGSFGLGLGSGDKDFSLFAVSTKAFGKNMVSVQLGYSWLGKNKIAGLRDIFIYGLAVDHAVSDTINIVSEINGNRHPDITQPDDPKTWLLGIIYKVSDKVVFDLAYKGGLSQASPDWNITSGASLAF